MTSEHDQVPMLEVADAIVELGGKALLDCLGCGTCSGVCPWGLVRPTSIRRVIREAALGLEGFEPESWRCLTCRACVDRCPQQIDLTEVMQAMRAVAAEAGGLPAGVSAAVGSLSAAGNPWGGEADARSRWSEGLTLAEHEGAPDLAYFTCCTPAYDPSARRAATSAVRLLELAGSSVGLLGDGEVCCGDLALRAGRPDIAESLAEQNLAAMAATGAPLVVTSSPHCRQAFEGWYPAEGRPPARHVVEVLAEALGKGRLELPGRYDRKVAYHDPCYLGRYAGVYEPPRELLRAVPGLELVELERSRESSLCCGGGGGGAWKETPQEERHALLRIDEVADSGAEVVVTACPLCLLMLEDAVRVRGIEEEIEVRDLCEVLLVAAEGPSAEEGP